jgi:diguanylate cyclase
MNTLQLLEQTRQYIRLALPLMAKHHIPITPKNYTIWYKYVSSSDPDLTRAMEAMIQEGAPFTEEANETLYQKFGLGEDESELRKIREDLQQALLTIHKEVTEFNDQTDEYETFVNASVKALSEETTLEEIRGFIHEIVEKTKTLGQFGKSIRGRLKETTENLEILKRDFERIKAEAALDFLTGVANRKLFESTLEGMIREAAGPGDESLSLLLIDIDRFKNFNDEHGHLIGDEVLKFVAKKIREKVRGQDLVARFGGEEFAVILYQTALAGAKTVAESIRSFFAVTSLKAKMSSRNLGSVTVSIGVASFRSGDSPESLVHRADRGLYLAKREGRNRIAAEEEAYGRTPVRRP